MRPDGNAGRSEVHLLSEFVSGLTLARQLREWDRMLPRARTTGMPPRARTFRMGNFGNPRFGIARFGAMDIAYTVS